MAVEVFSREYLNPYNVERADWLLGNVSDFQQLEFTFRTAVEFRASTQNMFGPGGEPNTYVLYNGRTWASYGFDIGDVVNMSFTVDFDPPTWNFTYQYQITLLQDDIMKFDIISGVWGDDWAAYPGERDGITLKNFHFWTDKRPEGLRLGYGHMKNSIIDSLNIGSVIDGSTTELLVNQLETMPIGGFQLMDKIGIQSGMSILSGTIGYWGKIGTHYYSFIIYLPFIISAIFEDQSNIPNQIPPSHFLNTECLTDNMDILAYPEWNNPNSTIRNEMSHTKRLGNTGWENQNFNELEDPYTVESVLYFDNLGNPLTQLDHTQAVTAEVVISGIDNLTVGQTMFNFGFWLLSKEESVFKNNENSFHENLRFSNGNHDHTEAFILGDPPSTWEGGYQTGDNAYMATINTQVTQVGPDSVMFTTTFLPSPQFTTLVESRNESDRKYLFHVIVRGDHTLDTNNALLVTKRVDYNSLLEQVAPVGPFGGLTNSFYEHPDLTSDPTAGYTEYDGFVEDDILGDMNLLIDQNDNIEILDVRFKIEALDMTTNLSYELENFPVNTSIFPIVSGIQQIDVQDTRGFNYEPGYEKNDVVIERDPSLDFGTTVGYTMHYGFKARWEHWLSRSGVPLLFFDAAEENNAASNDWYLYSRNINAQLQLAVYLHVIQDGEELTYKNTYDFDVRDYDSNTLEVETEWEFYRVSDGSLLNIGLDPETGAPVGALPSGEQVRVEILYRRIDGQDWCVDDVYSATCIQIDRGSGIPEHRQISSVHGRETDCPLIPIPGETLLQVNFVSSTEILTKCILDDTLLLAANGNALKYALSGRIGCGNGDGGQVPGCEGMIYEDNDCILLENDNNLIVE